MKGRQVRRIQAGQQLVADIVEVLQRLDEGFHGAVSTTDSWTVGGVRRGEPRAFDLTKPGSPSTARNIRRVLLVIVGAGASWDCVSGIDPTLAEHRPPLANSLFTGPDSEEVLLEVRVAQTAVADMRDELRSTGRTVEEVLQSWRDEATGSPYRQRSLYAIQFFLQRRLEKASKWRAVDRVARGITNYVHLARRLDYWREHAHEPVICVTFNYDTLLDDALHWITYRCRKD